MNPSVWFSYFKTVKIAVTFFVMICELAVAQNNRMQEMTFMTHLLLILLSYCQSCTIFIVIYYACILYKYFVIKYYFIVSCKRRLCYRLASTS